MEDFRQMEEIGKPSFPVGIAQQSRVDILVSQEGPEHADETRLFPEVIVVLKAVYPRLPRTLLPFGGHPGFRR